MYNPKFLKPDLSTVGTKPIECYSTPNNEF